MKLTPLVRAAGLASILMLAAAPAGAQPLVTPEIHPDRTVTFRHRAPEAKDVVLRLEALPAPQPMTRDAQGVWSFTTGTLEPDIYVYSLLVDGQRVLDPANPLIKYNLFNTENQVHVPGPKDLPWEFNDVPHGVLHRHHYRSAIINAERDVWVYTPPGYESATGQKFPVLYLLHGFSDAEDAWTSVGRAHVILDNLIARGQAKPMIVVMPRGYGNREITAGGWGVIRGPDGQRIWQDSNAKFGDSLRKEIIPLVEKDYRVSPGPESRAIAGLSMGGTQSLLNGLNAPDRFGWIGAFSSGGLPGDYESHFAGVGEELNVRLRLLWIACGTEDGLIAANRDFTKWLTSRGVRHTFVETPGRHSFLVWRRYLAQFAPLLFREPAR